MAVAPNRRMRVTAAVRLLAGDKEPVRLASTANLTRKGLPTVDGILVKTVDGILVKTGDRILVKDQTNAKENGIYTANAGLWQRAGDSSSGTVMIAGMKVAVQEGATQAGDVWVLDTNRPNLGDDDIGYSLYLNTTIADDINAAREVLVAETETIIAMGLGAGKATQAEAEAGVTNVPWMTPLRTAQAIAVVDAAQTIANRMPARTIKANPTSGLADPTNLDVTALSAKTPLDPADVLLIQDSAASYAFKKATVGAVVAASRIPIPTVSFTFDYYKEGAFDAMNASMSSRGLVATHYVAPSTIGTAGFLTADQLLLMVMQGWEIGWYTNENMVTARVANRTTCFAKFKQAIADLQAVGIYPKTLGANQRAWDSTLAGMAYNSNWVGVRNAATTADQTWPVPNPWWVDYGGTASWGSSDTLQSLKDKLDATIAAKTWWIPIIHKIGSTPDSFTISATIFDAFMAYVKTKRDAGLVRVCTFERGLMPAYA